MCFKILQDRDGIECPRDRDVKVSRGEQVETEDDIQTPLTHECCMQSLSALQGSTANESQTYAIQLVYMSEKLYFFNTSLLNGIGLRNYHEQSHCQAASGRNKSNRIYFPTICWKNCSIPSSLPRQS